MPIFMIIALDIVITLRFSINWSSVICSPIVLFAILREASSATYAPRFIFHHITFRSTILIFDLFFLQSFTFRSINQKYQKIFTLSFVTFIYLYQISLLQVTVKGLTTPISRWVQVSLIVCAGIRWLVRCLLLDWYLGSQTKENTYSTLLHHPFLFKGKTNASSRGSRKNSWRRCRGNANAV